MATDKWTDGSDNWNTPSDWDDGLPTTTSNVIINEGDPQITSTTGPISIASLNNSSQLSFLGAGADSISGDLTNSGTIYVDTNYGGPGGTNLTVSDTVINTGTFNIGVSNLSAPSTITATNFNNFLNTTLGTINLTGNSSTSGGGPVQAKLDVTGAAGLGEAGEIIGSVNLSGDALLEFTNNEISTIAAGSELTLNGPDVSVQDDAAAPGINSGLTGLATITGGLTLYGIGPLTLTQGLTNTGNVNIDNEYGGPGGTNLTIEGALTNSGTFNLGVSNLGIATTVTATGLDDFLSETFGTINLQGNSSTTGGGPFLATLDIQKAVNFGSQNGFLYGSVNLSGDSLLEFSSGQVTTIAIGSELTLTGPNASVQNATATTNSALTGLKTVTGALNLNDIAPLTLTQGLTNTGNIYIDNAYGDGGSNLTVTGALTNSATINIGTGSLSAATTVTANSLVNSVVSAYGTINISGSTNTSNPVPVSATLDILSVANSVLTGSVNLTGNVGGHGVLEFKSGSIGAIAVNSELSLNGPGAFVADASNLASNGALATLATLNGALNLSDSAPVTLSQGLANTGTLNVDTGYGNGASRLTIKGALTNTGIVNLGTGSLASATKVTADSLVTSVGSALGTINISGYTGNTAPIPVSATLDITGAANSVLTGSINITGEADGAGVLEFGSGGITTIAANSELTLTGPDAFVDDEMVSGDDSALTGLTTINGALNLTDIAPLTLSQGLTNTGTINIDTGYAAGGSDLTITDALTNSGTVNLGTSNLSVATTVAAGGLNNTSTINITGGADFATTLAITGAANNDAGSISVGDYGVFTVDGSYTQTAGANLGLQLSSASQHSSLAVTGGVDIAGGTLTANLNGVTLAAGQTYNLATFTDGDLKGVYDTLSIPGDASGASTHVNISSTLIAGLVYDDAAGNIQLQIETAPTSTADTWSGGVGSWTAGSATGWANGATQFYSDVTIGSTSTAAVTLTSDATVDSVTLNAGDSLTTNTGTDLSIGTTLATTANSTLTVGGEAFVDGAADDSGSIVVDGTLLDIRGAVTGSGGFTIDGGATLDLSGAVSGAGQVSFASSGALATLQLDGAAAPANNGTFSETLANFSGNDALDLTGLSYVSGGATTASVSGSTLTVTNGTTTENFTLSNPAATYYVSQDSGTGTLITDSPAPCYVRGTRILTERGEVAVEDLRVGDLAITASGVSRPIRWLGHRHIDIAHHRDPAAVRPVRVSRGAFGEGLPHTDLWLSPGHNVACDNVLTPVCGLVNGVSVVQVAQAEVEYWHVELDAHDVMLAEGLPAESYLDTGNRTGFANGGAFVEMFPDFAPKHWAETCLPLVHEGPALAKIKARLLEVLRVQGLEPTSDSDAHIIADGRRIAPISVSATRLSFVLPEDCRDIVLTSRRFTPTHVLPESADSRELGICIARLRIDGVELPLERDDLFEAGWREAECEGGRAVRRWTGGAARLPQGARIVLIDLGSDGDRYWRGQDEIAAALAA